MNDMWSENRYVNATINILLFMMAINVMHYGQLLLPVVCLIIFIDNKFKFHVCNIKTFVILCLFAVSFFAFSYKMGFYSVMAFCMPMAYYVGCNMREPNEDKIMKLIYMVAFAMALHIVLNFAYDYSILGSGMMRRHDHYDIWTRGIVSTTTTAVNCILIIACTYYLVIYEKNKAIKAVGLVLCAICLIYDMALGRRTPVFVFGIAMVISVTFDLFVLKNTRNRKASIMMVLIPASFVGLMIVLYAVNLFNIREVFDNLRFVIQMKEAIVNTERLGVLYNTLLLAPYHLWGGTEISAIVGWQPHELWLDIFDYAGLITYILIVIYSLLYLAMLIKLFKKNTSDKFKLFIFDIISCTTIIMFLEPIMTGNSIFLVFTIIFGATLEKLNINYEKE